MISGNWKGSEKSENGEKGRSRKGRKENIKIFRL